MSKDNTAEGIATGEQEAVENALNARDDAKSAARSQLFNVMKNDTGEDTPEEEADAPETTEDTSEQEEEPVETTTEESEEEEEESDEKSDETSEEESVDVYKAALEKEKARRERAERKILKLKKEDKEEEDGTSNEEEQVNSVIEAARQLLKEELEISREQEVNEIVDVALDDLSSSDSERELMEYHYNNTIKRSGVTKNSILEDLSLTKILANKEAIINQNEELKKALSSKQTTATAPEFSGRPMQQAKGMKLSGADKTLMRKFGITEKDLAKKSK